MGSTDNIKILLRKRVIGEGGKMWDSEKKSGVDRIVFF